MNTATMCSLLLQLDSRIKNLEEAYIHALSHDICGSGDAEYLQSLRSALVQARESSNAAHAAVKLMDLAERAFVRADQEAHAALQQHAALYPSRN